MNIIYNTTCRACIVRSTNEDTALIDSTVRPPSSEQMVRYPRIVRLRAPVL